MATQAETPCAQPRTSHARGATRKAILPRSAAKTFKLHSGEVKLIAEEVEEAATLQTTRDSLCARQQRIQETVGNVGNLNPQDPLIIHSFQINDGRGFYPMPFMVGSG